MPFYCQPEIEARAEKELFPGIVARSFWADNLLAARIEFAPNAAAPRHAHPNVQAGIIIRGQLTMEVDGETRTLGPGELYIAPGDVPHQATAGPEGCVAIECFTPLREALVY